MLDLLFSTNYLPFTTALLILVSFLLIEVLGFFVAGTTLGGLIDNIFDHEGFSGHVVMDWLLPKETPFSLAFSLGLFGFGIVGIGVQELLVSGLWVALPFALVSTFLSIRVGSHFIGPLFKTRTDAVSEQTLIGRTAIVKSRLISNGSAGEILVKDQFGNSHYLMAEPEKGELKEGAEVVIVGRKDYLFVVELLSIESH